MEHRQCRGFLQRYERRTEEFFAGSIVLNNQRLSNDNVIEIIDGQQRMITSTILLAAIRTHSIQ